MACREGDAFCARDSVHCGVSLRAAQRNASVKSIAILAEEICGSFNMFQAEEAVDRAAACDGR